MAKINTHFNKLSGSYFSAQIVQRMQAFQAANPGVEVLKLGIGNTTEPITPSILAGLRKGVENLASASTYTGYGDEQGDQRLRQAFAAWYGKIGVKLEPSEIFISDGAKPDTANIQQIFDPASVIAVQDPVYPVYVDSNVIAGRTGAYKDGLYEGIVYMPCTEENEFFPQMPTERVDLIYFCSPNNPTGAVATREQLKTLVDFALEKKAIIIFDAAYTIYISDDTLPRSIYEIDGAKECAIEISSLSKSAGFTGVRLGWTVVPHALRTEASEPGVVNQLWNRRQTTMFNGASNIVQEGGLAALSEQGQRECQELVDYYMHNARVIKEGLGSMRLTVHGGENAPYIWLKTPGGMGSWAFFDKLLAEAHVVGIPGNSFGPEGEGYFRLSAFGHRADIEKAVASIKKNLKL